MLMVVIRFVSTHNWLYHIISILFFKYMLAFAELNNPDLKLINCVGMY